MTVACDMTDVPAVTPEELALAVRLLVDAGRTPRFEQGLSDELADRIERAFWLTFEGDPARGLAILLRFRSLVDVLLARRLKHLMRDQHHALVAHAVAVAATMRLNANWGFSPHKFLAALKASLDGVGAGAICAAAA